MPIATLALRFHPDRAGEQSTELFREIVEAYQTLSNPQARRSYDLGLEHAERGESPRPPIITPTDPVRPTVLDPLSELRDFHRAASPSLEEILERIERNFSGLGVPKSERTVPLDLTLVLSPDEAALGGLLRFNVPVYYPCPGCHGSGEVWPFVCQCCSGHGMVTEREQIAIRVAPFVEDGALRSTTPRPRHPQSLSPCLDARCSLERSRGRAHKAPACRDPGARDRTPLRSQNSGDSAPSLHGSRPDATGHAAHPEGGTAFNGRQTLGRHS